MNIAQTTCHPCHIKQKNLKSLLLVNKEVQFEVSVAVYSLMDCDTLQNHTRVQS